jgi:hypothetical protein
MPQNKAWQMRRILASPNSIELQDSRLTQLTTSLDLPNRVLTPSLRHAERSEVSEQDLTASQQNINNSKTKSAVPK